MPLNLEAGFERYLIIRQQQETDRVAAIWSVMTKRERQLVHDVAVMAAVRANLGTKPPPDSEVLADAISACLSMPDLYPTVTRLKRLANRRQAIQRHEEDRSVV